MAFYAKQKLLYYKKYRTDIWGCFKNTLLGIADNTVYKTGNILYRIKNLKKFIFYTNKEYFYYFDKLKEKVKIYKKKFKLKHKDIKWNKFFKKKKVNGIYLSLIRPRYKAFLRLMFYINLWKSVFKIVGSNKMQKIIDLFMIKKQIKEKVYFKRPFIYEPRVPFLGKKKIVIKGPFMDIYMLRLFYIIYTFKQLSHMAKKIKNKKGIFEQNFLTVLEAKLPSFMYRTSFFSTLFESLKFVKQNNIWINKKFKPFVFYTVKLFDIVGFRILYKSYIFWNFFKRLRRRAFLFIFPLCFYISLSFFFIILIRRITLKDLINTFNMDYYAILSYMK